MLIKTSELTGAALDWAVAKCEGKNPSLFIFQNTGKLAVEHNYSANWAQGGPIIEREKFDRISTNVSGGFTVSKKFVELRDDDSYSIRWVHGSGTTPLIATMRCYVASKLGDTVEIPDDLMV